MTCEHENTPHDGGPTDALVDTNLLPNADAQQCFGSGLGTFCLTALPTGNLAFASDTTIDTDTSTMCVAYTGTGVGSYCVIAGTNVSIGAHVTAIGSKPLVVIGTNTVTVSGTLDVASHRVGPVRGAGGNASGCVAGIAAASGQGGPGGSFGGAGGQGGNGEQGGTKPVAGAAAATPATLRGGCKGGNGSSGGNGEGGNGGGAVYVIAGTSIAITGAINASGAAGARSATNEEGGGGGGSGGMIALEAPAITGNGQVFANGGGAGPGNDASNNAQEPSAPLTAAAGGPDTDDSGDGGDGSAGATLTGGNGGTGNDGGGGGGGGAGVIRVFPTQTLGGSVSPPTT
jgi:hypothetical protein